MIEQAVEQIREDMARLVAKMRERGHDRATALFEIDRAFTMRIGLRTGDIGHDGERAFVAKFGPYRYPFSFVSGTTYAETLAEAEAEIERMELSIALACEAWFQTEAA